LISLHGADVIPKRAHIRERSSWLARLSEGVEPDNPSMRPVNPGKQIKDTR
jgi:hypothetical protein